MTDPRINKLADVLINYSLGIKPGHQLVIQTNPLAEELLLACYREAMKAGAHVFVINDPDDLTESFYKHASDEQLDFISPVTKLIYETFDARLVLSAEQNTRSLSRIDPQRQSKRAAAMRPTRQVFFDRAARNELRWCLTEFPTYASAQEADMSLEDYREFVYNAGKLNDPDPVAAWKKEGERQMQLVNWLAGHDQVHIRGSNVDLKLSIKGRTFIPCDGKFNFPDGEIFTGPVEQSVTGWVRFGYPAIFGGREVENVELWFEDGKVVREKATKGQDYLTATLNMDAGARYLGEWGIGTNYDIPCFSKNMLFDEKLGGTIHLALGASYPETGGLNSSGLHWDMLCDMADSEIVVDGEVFYRNGRPVMW